MVTSIGKYSKSFLVKLLVGIIILPFVFWGMGDVFRGGNQNVIATIDSNKVSTQEFMNHLNRMNLNNQQIKNFKQNDLVEKILSDFIGRKVMQMEIEKSGIKINDNSLRNIIKNDKLFFKDNKFSRVEYEKFLLKSGVTAPGFEKNIAEQESKRQFLDYIASGITIPNILVEKAFKQENQLKTIKYIDLNKYYSSIEKSKEKFKELYEKNKTSFSKNYKSFQYAEITPLNMTGNDEYGENFFKQLDILENNILDGQSFEDASKGNNLKIIKIKKVDDKKIGIDNKKIENLSDKIFKKFFAISLEKTPEVLKIDNKYYLVELEEVSTTNKTINDPDVIKIINAQLEFINKLEANTSIVKDISMGGYNEQKLKEFAKKNALELKDYTISSLKQNDVFNEGIIKRIFLSNDGEVELITDSTLTSNFLVLALNTKFNKLDKESDVYEQYKAKAKLKLINNIYETFDRNLNEKYKVELNKKTIERVKNSF